MSDLRLTGKFQPIWDWRLSAYNNVTCSKYVGVVIVITELDWTL